MAIVVVNEMQGADQGVYDDVNPRVMPGGELPEGCKAHIAGPVAGGWRVITVWESEERFKEFRDQNLIPALKEAGYGDRIAPNITTSDVYRLITA